jgi:hypothetical protein
MWAAGWSIGVLEYWSIGVLECWSVGPPGKLDSPTLAGGVPAKSFATIPLRDLCDLRAMLSPGGR